MKTKLTELINQAKLIIFDMNGLIVDDEGQQLLSTQLTFKKYGVKISKKDWLTWAVGRRTEFIFAKLIKKNNLTVSLDKLIIEKDKYYRELMKKNIKKLSRKKITYLIKKLHGQKPLAVATSASKIEENIILGKNGLDLKKYFRLIVNVNQVNKPKPNPEIYLKITKALKIKTKETLVFEDSIVGVRAAKRAGMKVVAVPNEFTRQANFAIANLVWKI